MWRFGILYPEWWWSIAPLLDFCMGCTGEFWMSSFRRRRHTLEREKLCKAKDRLPCEKTGDHHDVRSALAESECSPVPQKSGRHTRGAGLVVRGADLRPAIQRSEPTRRCWRRERSPFRSGAFRYSRTTARISSGEFSTGSKSSPGAPEWIAESCSRISLKERNRSRFLEKTCLQMPKSPRRRG